VQRKIFKIEQMLHARVAAREAGQTGGGEARRERSACGEAIAQSARELSALRRSASAETVAARARRELGAAIGEMEQATQRILKAAESANARARKLPAAPNNDSGRHVARDMQESITEIIEACGFQDLVGQRLNKAIDALGLVDERLERLFAIWDKIGRDATITPSPNENRLLNGPKLKGDADHLSQIEIDRLFRQRGR
jgi:chemotaxis protein CheZ